jgi:hypothetical protein
MQDWLEPLAGGIVLAITLLDVFLTVLYARADAGLLAPWLARGVWRVFRALSGGIDAQHTCGRAWNDESPPSPSDGSKYLTISRMQ